MVIHAAFRPLGAENPSPEQHGDAGQECSRRPGCTTSPTVAATDAHQAAGRGGQLRYATLHIATNWSQHIGVISSLMMLIMLTLPHLDT